MKKLNTILTDYLAMRRALGFSLRKHETALRDFVTFFTAHKTSYLTTKIAMRWARKPQNTDHAWWTERLSMVRGFANYWKILEPRTEVPPVQLLLPQYKRPAPFIYTDRQMARILALTQRLPTDDRTTYWTLYGLLAATGMRVGEALALNDEDIDLKQGVITLRKTKLDKPRLLPLHPTTRKILQQHVRRRKRQFPRPKVSSFFVVMDGRRPSYHMAWSTFRKVLFEMGLRSPSQRKGPRLHDLRHTFAVRALMGFYRNGRDMDQKIHALSTYLGHKGIECTYWYLTAVPELMSLALSRLEKKIGGAL